MKYFTLNGKEFYDRLFVLSSCSVLFEFNFRLLLTTAHISQLPPMLFALAFIALYAFTSASVSSAFIVSSFLLRVLSSSYTMLLQVERRKN
jgi:hypothetical protein